MENAARPAVLVRRTDLPVPLDHPVRSYFGGLPSLPPHIEWPRAEVRNERGEAAGTVALTFVAQIDLAELPAVDPSPLPKHGTLFFFCSSMFIGEACPPCRVFYNSARADAHPSCEPPSDLMPLGGAEGYGAKWLYPSVEFHSQVEFKYPLSFLSFRDFDFDECENDLKAHQLVKALGPPEPYRKDILQFRTFADYAQDPHWPFNWLLINYVARSISYGLNGELKRSYKPLSETMTVEFKRILTEAVGWLERSRSLAPFAVLDADTKSSFRSWWMSTYQSSKKANVSFSMTTDLSEAIDQTIRAAVVYDASARGNVPLIYLENLAGRNHFQGDQSDHCCIAMHQMLGYGISPALDEHQHDVLLLQIQGDLGLQQWHSNIGCLLNFWIEPAALDRLDFSTVTATLDCD